MKVKRLWLWGSIGLVLGGCVLRPPVGPVTSTPSGTVVTASETPAVVSSTPAASVTPESNWWNEGVFYEVFVRSFSDSDGDGVGDLNGLTAKLDYLNDGDSTTTGDLGVRGIWLMPVTESPSYHGYDVVDYYQVERDYGSREEFQRLVAEAHRRGIRVIVDLVLNHTSSQHPWFVDSRSGPEAAKRNWYLWADKDLGALGLDGQRLWHPGDGAWYYAYFWSEMPDLNYANPEVTAQADAIARYWLEEMGVDGFRLDAARYLVEERLDQRRPWVASTKSTQAWLRQFRQSCRAVNPEAVTVGEVWADSDEVAPYVAGGSLDLAFEFTLAGGILEAVESGSSSELRILLEQIQKFYPQGAYATFLTNHDQNRVMDEVQGDWARARLAAVTYLTLPGVPFIYYGEEIGMRGSKPDELIRTPMQWSAEAQAGFTTGKPWEAVNPDYSEVNVADQMSDPNSLWNLYRQLTVWRSEYAALRTGTLTLAESGADPVLAYLRVGEPTSVVVLMNYGLSAQPVTLSWKGAALPAGSYQVRDLVSGKALAPVTIGEGGAVNGWGLPELSAQQFQVLVLTP